MDILRDTFKFKNFLDKGQKPVNIDTMKKASAEEKRDIRTTHAKNLGLGLAGAGLKKIVQSDTAKDMAGELLNKVGQSLTKMKTGGQVMRLQPMPSLNNVVAMRDGGNVYPYPRREAIIPYVDMSHGVYKSGGNVKLIKGVKNKYSKNHDTVPAILQVGEYIVNKKDAKSKAFKKFLKTKKKK